MIIMKKALPRRTFLRGVGATLALPLLDAMVPALAAREAATMAARHVPNETIADFHRTGILRVVQPRLSAIEQWDLGEPQAVVNEVRHGLVTIASGETLAGAARFNSGTGRHGDFATG